MADKSQSSGVRQCYQRKISSLTRGGTFPCLLRVLPLTSGFTFPKWNPHSQIFVISCFDINSQYRVALCLRPLFHASVAFACDRQNSLKLSYPSTFVQTKYKSSAARQSS